MPAGDFFRSVTQRPAELGIDTRDETLIRDFEVEVSQFRNAILI
jgi:hypothetical protein